MSFVAGFPAWGEIAMVRPPHKVRGRVTESGMASHPKCLLHIPLSCGRLRTSRSSQRSRSPSAPTHSSRHTDRTVPYRHSDRRSDLPDAYSDPRLSAPPEVAVRKRLVHYG